MNTMSRTQTIQNDPAIISATFEMRRTQVEEAIGAAKRVVPEYVQGRNSVNTDDISFVNQRELANIVRQFYPGQNIDGPIAGFTAPNGRIYINSETDPASQRHTIIHESLHGMASKEGEAWVQTLGIRLGVGSGNGTQTSLAEQFIERMAQLADPRPGAAYPHEGMGQLFLQLKGERGQSGFELMVRAVMNNDKEAQSTVEKFFR
jgi:hypothetical protein